MSDGKSVITVGNFDGVHRGHQALLAAGRAEAERLSAALLIISFDPHPATVLRPQQAPPPLMDRAQRLAALTEAGADRVEWLRPDPSVLNLSPQQFVERVVQQHHPIAWLEGPDFRFGHRRAGDVALLRRFGEKMGFAVRVIDPIEVTLRDKSRCVVGSSLIRWLLEAGRVSDAQLCLGRPFAVRGTVIEGDRRGRHIGFPTANLDTADRILPADGVYAGIVEIDGQRKLAAVSVGTKPTFGQRQRTFEAYVLDYEGDLYDLTLEVKVVRWLREQLPFDGVGALVDQMSRDVQQMRWLAADGLLNPVELISVAAS